MDATEPLDVMRPREDDASVAALSRAHLEQLVAFDSHADEHARATPSTEGQRRLADEVAAFFARHGARVERDAHAHVIATIAGQGIAEGRPPLALMAHLDTTPGTVAVPRLGLVRSWDGAPLPFPANPHLSVDVETYPAAREFLGHDVLFGPGDRPFGLDDKLGLAHLMTLAVLLRANPAIAHPPIVIVARPDEEIGRTAAVTALAGLLGDRRIASGYTVDGILPFEVNAENFNASVAEVTFPSATLHCRPTSDELHSIDVALGGVNTHGCTAKAEGHRNAVRFAAEVVAALVRAGVSPRWIVPVSIASDPNREVDATVQFVLGGPEFEALAALEQALSEVVGPHERRGASWTIESPVPCEPSGFDCAPTDLLRFVHRFLLSRPGFPVAAEESEGREGYSNPFRAEPVEGGVRLHLRLRDFDEAGLSAREDHVRAFATELGGTVEIRPQYVNMGPRMAAHPELVERASLAAEAIGRRARVLPIRGGTGVDPFLDRGIPVANLGTGYFAPESEKEFTSLQMMALHARWLVALVQT